MLSGAFFFCCFDFVKVQRSLCIRTVDDGDIILTVCHDFASDAETTELTVNKQTEREQQKMKRDEI